jgi:hypothetical protein
MVRGFDIGSTICGNETFGLHLRVREEVEVPVQGIEARVRPLEEIAKSGRLSVASLDEVRSVFETNVWLSQSAFRNYSRVTAYQARSANKTRS